MPGDGTAGATLHDLRNEDKLKIGNLLRELARTQREGQQATRERSQYAERLNQMRSQNNLIVQETVKLRGKFRQSLHLLKSYQQRLGDDARLGGQLESSAAQPRPSDCAPTAPVAHDTRCLSSFCNAPEAGASVTAAGRSNDVRAVNVTSLAAIETTSQVDGLPDVNASAAEAQQSRLQDLETLREHFPRAAAAYESRAAAAELHSDDLVPSTRVDGRPPAASDHASIDLSPSAARPTLLGYSAGTAAGPSVAQATSAAQISTTQTAAAKASAAQATSVAHATAPQASLVQACAAKAHAAHASEAYASKASTAQASSACQTAPTAQAAVGLATHTDGVGACSYACRKGDGPRVQPQAPPPPRPPGCLHQSSHHSWLHPQPPPQPAPLPTLSHQTPLAQGPACQAAMPRPCLGGHMGVGAAAAANGASLQTGPSLDEPAPRGVPLPPRRSARAPEPPPPPLPPLQLSGAASPQSTEVGLGMSDPTKAVYRPHSEAPCASASTRPPPFKPTAAAEQPSAATSAVPPPFRAAAATQPPGAVISAMPPPLRAAAATQPPSAVISAMPPPCPSVAPPPPFRAAAPPRLPAATISVGSVAGDGAMPAQAPALRVADAMVYGAAKVRTHPIVGTHPSDVTAHLAVPSKVQQGLPALPWSFTCAPVPPPQPSLASSLQFLDTCGPLRSHHPFLDSVASLPSAWCGAAAGGDEEIASEINEINELLDIISGVDSLDHHPRIAQPPHTAQRFHAAPPTAPLERASHPPLRGGYAGLSGGGACPRGRLGLKGDSGKARHALTTIGNGHSLPAGRAKRREWCD